MTTQEKTHNIPLQQRVADSHSSARPGPSTDSSPRIKRLDASDSCTPRVDKSSAAHTRVPVLDVDVTPVTAHELLEHLDAGVAERRQLTVLAHNLHSVYLFHTDAEFRRTYKHAEIVVVDGMPVLAALSLGRIARGRPPLSVSRRIGSTDWIKLAVQLPSVERVALLGASPASNRLFAFEGVEAGTRARVGVAVGG